MPRAGQACRLVRPLGHATGGGPIVLSRIVGPVVQTGTDTFALRFSRAEYPANRRNNDMWIVASQPGDGQYKSIVQQAMVHAQPNTDGTAQQITFQEIPDQKANVKSLTLRATSDAGVPVSYYVREGPAEVDGAKLEFHRHTALRKVSRGGDDCSMAIRSSH